MEEVMVRKAVLFLSIISLLNFTAGCTSSSYLFIPRGEASTASPDSGAAFTPDKPVEETADDGNMTMLVVAITGLLLICAGAVFGVPWDVSGYY
jgi:hypothetical protein